MTVRRFEQGDRVRIDIPDKSDPDYHLHGRSGLITDVAEDDAGEETDDIRDSVIYRVQLDSGTVMDFRWRDLRPASQESE